MRRSWAKNMLSEELHRIAETQAALEMEIIFAYAVTAYGLKVYKDIDLPFIDKFY